MRKSLFICDSCGREAPIEKEMRYVPFGLSVNHPVGWGLVIRDRVTMEICDLCIQTLGRPYRGP
jgi:hypothetical protein